MIKISDRLLAIAQYIKDDAKIIDIGCDHALLDIYLAQKHHNLHLIISDINQDALAMGITNLKKYQLETRIEARLGNGLDVVNPEEINTVIISGLGAHKIVGILLYNQNKLINVEQLVLQSNNNIDFLRAKITKMGFYIENETLVKENGIIYTVINFIRGKKKYNTKEIYFGPILLKEQNELFKEKNNQDLAKLESLLKVIPKNKYFYRNRIKKKIKLYPQN